MATWNPRANDLFLNALQLVAPEARRQLLDRECGTDTDLRAEVECLLEASNRARGFLARPATNLRDTEAIDPVQDDEETFIPHSDKCAGSMIGPYKLLQQIGEGGMGTVFMAEQTHPLRRRVALKVIRTGMDSRQVIARFEAERQALALMDHINIARVLDAGTDESGHPYFVMELVQGIPITRYCDDNQLTPRQRLELFIPVCRAIQHAHQKGIIHRDIKPSNVMITLQDGMPVPKVIDFGVAKAIEQKLTEQTLFTHYGTMVGTLEYMSPEQAEMSTLGVDTRSDIYSIGVLLYELLTGSTPLSLDRVRKAAYSDLLRMLKEEDPPKPSTRLSHSGEALAIISAQRQTEPAKLMKILQGELDWIVMKTLEKDRNRRYETVNGLATDLLRHLNDEAVQACPPSTYYRFRKFARRNKGMFATASALLLVAITGVGALAASNLLIRQEQTRTQREKTRAEHAQKLAQNRAEEIKRGLDGLKAANALLDRGRWYAAERRWDDALAAYTKAIRLRPEHVSAWVERSNLYAHLGLWDLAAADYDREIQLREPESTLRWYQHTLLRHCVGDEAGYRLASQKMREQFRGTTRLVFLEEVLRGSFLNPSSISEPDRELQQLVNLAEKVAYHHPWSSYSLYILGTAYYRAGHYEQAVDRLKSALTATDWSNRLLSYPILAMAYHRLGRTAEARQALDEATRVINQWTSQRYPSPDTYWVMHQGANAVWPLQWWDYLECQLYYREAMMLIEGVPPPDDPRLHVLRARSFAGLRKNVMAEPEYEIALKLMPGDPQIQLEAFRNSGYRHVHERQWTEAAAQFARAAQLRPDDSYLWRFQAMAHLASGNEAAFKQITSTMLDRFSSTEDPISIANLLLVYSMNDQEIPDPQRLLTLTRYSDHIWHWGDWVRGATLYRAGKFSEAVLCFETLQNTYSLSARDWCFLAMAHLRLGHFEETRLCLAKAHRYIDEANSRIDETSPGGENDPTGSHAAWGDWDDQVSTSLLLLEAEASLTKAQAAP